MMYYALKKAYYGFTHILIFLKNVSNRKKQCSTIKRENNNEENKTKVTTEEVQKWSTWILLLNDLQQSYF